MPINFNDERNARSYTGRAADTTWRDAMLSIVDPSGLHVADIGCGGGIYSSAWMELGAASVVGIDSSPVMVSSATKNIGDLQHVTFQLGDASRTGLASASVDIVFERALMHHLTDTGVEGATLEAMRVLVRGGRIIIQDRTPDDILVAGSFDHLRGYFFECFPRLLGIENARRKSDEFVREALCKAGFYQVQSFNLWETRKTYTSVDSLLDDVRSRTGRSLLHELDDGEIDTLVRYIADRLSGPSAIVERDRWTVWTGVNGPT